MLPVEGFGEPKPFLPLGAPNQLMEATRSRDNDPETKQPPEVRAYGTAPDRTVFTEADNEDAWISTDLTVENTE